MVLAGCGGGGGSTTGGQPGAGISKARAVDWPYFGRVPERTRFLTDAPDPPFSFGWVFFAHQLIEFPPALAGDEMFVVNKAGGVFAVRKSDGKVRWKRDLGSVVTGPAYAGGMGLAGMCDVLLATDRARFAMPEIRTGLFPMIIVAHLARAVPRKHLLDNRLQAAALGLIHYRFGRPLGVLFRHAAVFVQVGQSARHLFFFLRGPFLIAWHDISLPNRAPL